MWRVLSQRETPEEKEKKKMGERGFERRQSGSQLGAENKGAGRAECRLTESSKGRRDSELSVTIGEARLQCTFQLTPSASVLSAWILLLLLLMSEHPRKKEASSIDFARLELTLNL